MGRWGLSGIPEVHMQRPCLYEETREIVHLYAVTGDVAFR
jgi:hypothetical protein